MSYCLVAAIDLGTTFSGCAFSYLHDFKNDPLKILTIKWSSGMGQVITDKISTSVLFNKGGQFHSFGYEAEDKYSSLAFDDEHHDWYYFRRFKMILNDKRDFSRETLMEDVKGKKLEAMKVFSATIGYLRNHLLSTFKAQLTDIEDSDIRWVLTVPAIWTDPSKQFMREAAEKAGIHKDRLVITTKSEAASIYCMHLPVQKDSENSTFGVFKSGSKFMVVGAGGDTFDFTVHQVKDDGNLKELYKANDDNYGWSMVDSSFESLLAGIVGEDVFEKFTTDHKYDYLELMRDFDEKKRTIGPNLSGKLTFKIPGTLLETFREVNPEKNIQTVVMSNARLNNQLTWRGDKIRMEANLIRKALFDESCKKIVDHIYQHFGHPNLKDVSSILLVGGFAESPMLHEAVKEALRNKKVIVPQEAGVAVLKGAVLCGHQAGRYFN